MANEPSATGWLSDATVVGDVRDGAPSSLRGIHTALTHARGPTLVVAWDMPFITTDLLELVLSRAGGAPAVIIENGAGVEGCCAYYAPAALEVVARLLDAGEHRLTSLASALPGCVRLPRPEIASAGDPSRLFFNVNTPDDLATANAMAGT